MQLLFLTATKLKYFTVFSVALILVVNRTVFFFFFLLQVSVPPQKTSPTRSRTCGQSAAQTLEGRTL